MNDNDPKERKKENELDLNTQLEGLPCAKGHHAAARRVEGV
jgi:hypothetical protein